MVILWSGEKTALSLQQSLGPESITVKNSIGNIATIKTSNTIEDFLSSLSLANRTCKKSTRVSTNRIKKIKPNKISMVNSKFFLKK